MQQENQQQQFLSKQESQKQRYPKYNIALSNEKGFELENCFENLEQQIIGYNKNSDYYFDSYSHFNIHEDMLKDQVRTVSYQNSILKSKHLFTNKIVLDVGSGTGILSIFAAKAGAKHVYGVENANIGNQQKLLQNKLKQLNLADISRQIVKDNNFDDKITIIKGKIEEVEIPEKVDIIISEWMGYFLLYESMLDCVLFARDKYLKEGGLMFPDKAQLYLSTIEDEQYREEKLKFWNNPYDVDMSCIRQWVLREPLVEILDRKQINSEPTLIFDIDLQTVKKEELDFASQYQLKINRNDYVHAFIAFFEVQFSHSHKPITLSTSPFQRETHWKQTIFYLEEPLPVFNNDIIYGSIAVKKCKKNPRDLDIKLSVHLSNKIKQFNYFQYFKMN